EITSTAQSVTVEAPDLATSATGLPAINMVLPPHFSGDIDGIQITLHVQDMDSDGPADGAALSDTVTLNLRVDPVANDVQVQDPPAAPEDTAIAFLSGIGLADASGDPGDGGQEIITGVQFTLPAGFAATADGMTWSGPNGDWTVTIPAGLAISAAGTTITITGDPAGSGIQGLLSSITITPPAHSSA